MVEISGPSRDNVRPAQYYFISLVRGIMSSSHRRVRRRNVFLRAFMRISYRNRGRAPRVQIKMNDVAVVFKIRSRLEWFFCY